MTHFFLILLITFSLVLLTATLISYTKQRQARTKHGLTGMCHETGGEMCGCCSSKLMQKPHSIRQCKK